MKATPIIVGFATVLLVSYGSFLVGLRRGSASAMSIAALPSGAEPPRAGPPPPALRAPQAASDAQAQAVEASVPDRSAVEESVTSARWILPQLPDDTEISYDVVLALPAAEAWQAIARFYSAQPAEGACKSIK
jgi:hypothetical protein